VIHAAPPGANGRRILWFHPRSLLPAQSGGELRVTGLIDAAVARGDEVMVVQPGPLGESQPSRFRVLELPERRGLGLAIAKIFARSPLRSARITWAARRAARERIAHFDPDIAVVSDLLSWPLASRLMPAVPWIFDAHNVETDLYAEFATGATGVFDRLTFGVDSRRVARQEPRVARQADAVVTVSAEDAERLQAMASLERAPVVVPSSVPTPATITGPASEPRMLFVGTLDHPPNVQAVLELAGRIVPRVRAELPEARLVVIGRRPTPETRAAIAVAEGVELVEDAPDLEERYRASRCVPMPIRTGGGSRLKVYEALAYGVPVVGTTRALSGIVLPHDVAITADDEDGMVTAVLRVLTDEALAARLSAAARDYFLSALSWEHAAGPLLKLIDDLGRPR
jgi:glycosyltransferase involved in cell wall biosynthesis